MKTFLTYPQNFHYIPFIIGIYFLTSLKIDFVEWLRLPNNRIYWISGKAGSGKSVLMKLLINHPSTQSILDDSNGGALILSHFLWAAGQKLEKNVKGILLSVIHQLLTSNPDLCDLLLKGFPSAKQKDFPSDWSNEELREVSLYIFAAFGKHICLFLDGVDELDANEKQYFFSTIVKDLSNMPRLQICVSGRPEPEVQRYFGSYPQLRVQDLTRLDIEKYARDNLKELDVRDAERIESLIWQICDKASGVFLWVALALKSIQTGYSNNDDPAELEHRLRLLPGDLNTLYQQMWRRLNDSKVIYQETAARYFNLILECLDNEDLFRSPNILLLALALQPELAIKVLNNGSKSLIEDLDTECERILVHLPVRCAGILEITKEGKVTLLHRSAQEFLTNTLQGQAVRGADKVPSETRLFNLAQGLLACIKFTIEFKNQNSLEVTSRVLHLCKCFDNKQTDADSIFNNGRKNFVVQNQLSSDRVDEFLRLAESLYAEGWIFDSSFSFRPDFLGAIAMSGFPQQVSDKLSKLSSDAPEGMRVSDLYKLYIFGCLVDSSPSSLINSPVQCPALFSYFKKTRKEIDYYHNAVNFTPPAISGFGMIDKDGITVEKPTFSFICDTLTNSLRMSLFQIGVGFSVINYLDLVIRILEQGYNLFTKRVILVENSDLLVPSLFDQKYYQKDYQKYNNLPNGAFFIEVNTIFLLKIYIQLLENNRGYLSSIVDFPNTVGRLKRIISNLKAPASARLLAFTPPVPEESYHTKSTDEASEAIFVEESSADTHHGGEYFEDDDTKTNDQEGRQHESGDSRSGRDESGDAGSTSSLFSPEYHDKDHIDRQLWATSTRVLVPLTKADSDFVLDTIFSASLQSGTEVFDLLGPFVIPELGSRLQQISPSARLSTLSKLEETLLEAGFFIPWKKCHFVWPPSLYEPEWDDEEIGSQSVVLEKFLRW